MFEIRFDDEKLKQVQRVLRDIPKALPKVMSKGLNKTVMSARTKFARSLSKRIGIKVGRVRKYLIVKRATYSYWRSAIKVSNKRIPLIEFRARQTKKGVTYKDYVTGERGFVRHAFITQMRSGHRGVFIRGRSTQLSTGYDYMGRPRKWRLPIYEELGKPFSEVFKDYKDSDGYHLVKVSETILQKSIHDQVELILRRKLPA